VVRLARVAEWHGDEVITVYVVLHGWERISGVVTPSGSNTFPVPDALDGFLPLIQRNPMGTGK
jgi:hypothetical protein